MKNKIAFVFIFLCPLFVSAHSAANILRQANKARGGAEVLKTVRPW